MKPIDESKITFDELKRWIVDIHAAGRTSRFSNGPDVIHLDDGIDSTRLFAYITGYTRQRNDRRLFLVRFRPPTWMFCAPECGCASYGCECYKDYRIVEKGIRHDRLLEAIDRLCRGPVTITTETIY